MKDIVTPLLKAYKTLLSGITYNSVPVKTYYEYAPDSEDTGNYIVLSRVIDSDNSTINSQDSIVSINVKVHTWKVKDNNGLACADIAGQILEIIYPLGGVNINLRPEGMQLHSTKKTGDFTDSWEVNNQKVYVDRTLQFSHNIFYLNS